jgi:hypothetical protein
MRNLVMGLFVSCLFLAPLNAMQNSIQTSVDAFKKLPLKLDLFQFAHSDLKNYCEENNYKNVQFLGVAYISDNSCLGISLATLNQKNDICIFSRSYSYSKSGQRFERFTNSTIKSEAKITDVMVSEVAGLLGITLNCKNKELCSKAIFIFTNCDNAQGYPEMSFVEQKIIESKLRSQVG